MAGVPGGPIAQHPPLDLAAILSQVGPAEARFERRYLGPHVTAGLGNLGNLASFALDAPASIIDSMAQGRQAGQAFGEGNYGQGAMDLLNSMVSAAGVFPVVQHVPGGAFSKWFGESKAVDEAGQPRPVYHHGSFDESDEIPPSGPMHFGTEEAARQRAYGKPTDDALTSVSAYQADDGRWHWDDGAGLTSEDLGYIGYNSEDLAKGHGRQQVLENTDNSYGAGEDDLGVMTQAFLSIQNPKFMPDVGGGQGEWDAAIEQAKAEGFDGIIYRNQYEDKGSLSYIAFNPTQIKSVNNRGTWSATDPRITYGLAAALLGGAALAPGESEAKE